jgi:hypothetical protein
MSEHVESVATATARKQEAKGVSIMSRLLLSGWTMLASECKNPGCNVPMFVLLSAFENPSHLRLFFVFSFH